MEKTSVIRPDLTSPGAYLISSLCTMSWSSVTSGKWPSWSVSKCSRSWRHRSQKPRVRPCEPLCGLAGTQAGEDSPPAVLPVLGPIFSAPKSEQEKGIDAFLRQCLFTAARSASCRKGLRVLEIDAFSRFPERFDAKFEKSRRKAPCHNGLRRRSDVKLSRFA